MMNVKGVYDDKGMYPVMKLLTTKLLIPASCPFLAAFHPIIKKREN